MVKKLIIYVQDVNDLKSFLDNFEQTFHSWQKAPNIPFLWRPLYIAYPPLSQVLSNSQPPLPCSFCCLVSNAKCVITPHLLLCSRLGTWVPPAPCCVFYATRYSTTLIWYHTHKDKLKQYTQGLTIDWHTYKYILTPPLHTTTTLYCTEWITCLNKVLLYRGRQCLSFSKITHL